VTNELEVMYEEAVIT